MNAVDWTFAILAYLCLGMGAICFYMWTRADKDLRDALDLIQKIIKEAERKIELSKSERE